MSKMKTEQFFKAEFAAIHCVSQNFQVCICLWDEERQQWQSHGSNAGLPVFQLETPGKWHSERSVPFASLHKAAIAFAQKWPEEMVGIVAFHPSPCQGGELLMEINPAGK